jgi:hypothetical protein
MTENQRLMFVSLYKNNLKTLALIKGIQFALAQTMEEPQRIKWEKDVETFTNQHLASLLKDASNRSKMLADMLVKCESEGAFLDGLSKNGQ